MILLPKKDVVIFSVTVAFIALPAFVMRHIYREWDSSRRATGMIAQGFDGDALWDVRRTEKTHIIEKRLRDGEAYFGARADKALKVAAQEAAAREAARVAEAARLEAARIAAQQAAAAKQAAKKKKKKKSKAS